MIATAVKVLGKDGGENCEVRAGWASWDKGKHKERSVKYVYRRNGRIPRTAPEVPVERLVDMVLFALEGGELTVCDISRIEDAAKASRSIRRPHRPLKPDAYTRDELRTKR